jgi:hypothetical protein
MLLYCWWSVIRGSKRSSKERAIVGKEFYQADLALCCGRLRGHSINRPIIQLFKFDKSMSMRTIVKCILLVYFFENGEIFEKMRLDR